MNELWSHLRAT